MSKTSKSNRFKPVEIGKVDGIRTVIEAVTEEMTAFGGVAMLTRVAEKTGLVADLAKIVHDGRAQRYVRHKAEDILMQRVGQIGAGFPDGNDCDLFRTDPGFMLALGRDPVHGAVGCSQENTCKFEQRAVDRMNAKAVKELFVNHFTKIMERRPKEIVLDCDGTMQKTYGAQQGSVYRGGKYKHTMYFPLKIFSGQWLLATVLRRGDQSEAKTILDNLKMVVGKLRAKWPGVRIKVRMDSAFGSPALYEWLRKKKIGYEIGLRSNSVLNLYVKDYLKMAKEQFEKEHGEPQFMGKDGGQRAHAEHARIRGLGTEERMREEKRWRRRRVRVVGEFSYKPEKWKNWERVICRVDYTDKGPEVHFVLVSRQYGIPQHIYEEDYCQRGLTEQSIGKIKQTGKRLSAQEFYTNQLRLTLYGIAYTLMMHLRQYAAVLKTADVDTMRKKLMIMPMVLRRTAKKLVLQVSETHANCRIFLATWRRLSAT